MLEHPVLVAFSGMGLQVIPSEEFDWLLSTAEVAHGYGVGEEAIRSLKSRHSDELLPGRHWISVEQTAVANRNNGSITNKITFWTKRGVTRLGFHITTPRAAIFRDFAEELVMKKSAPPVAVNADPLQALKLIVSKFEQQDARIEALEKRVLQLPAPEKKQKPPTIGQQQAAALILPPVPRAPVIIGKKFNPARLIKLRDDLKTTYDEIGRRIGYSGGHVGFLVRFPERAKSRHTQLLSAHYNIPEREFWQ